MLIKPVNWKQKTQKKQEKCRGTTLDSWPRDDGFDPSGGLLWTRNYLDCLEAG